MNRSNSNSYYDLEKIKAAARNNWASIISSVGGASSDSFTGKHKPCPVCGGDDRFRFDNKGGEGTWYCSHGSTLHKGGKDAGDGLSLLVELKNGNFIEAVQALAQYLGIQADTKKTQPTKTTKPVAGQWCEYFSLKHDKYKKCLPVNVWDWAIDNNGCQWYLVRCEYEGKKIIFQMKYNPVVERLEQGTWGDSRPVLGTINTEKVLIVEGGTTLDAARQLLNGTDWSVVTWEGGTKAIAKTDWTCITQKDVYFFPDNDHDDPANNHHEESQKAMRKIAAIVRGYAKNLFYITPPAKEKHGWDLADAVKDNGWKQSNLLDYIKANARLMEQSEDDDGTIFKHFKLLGYQNGDYYFLSYIEQKVVKISSTQFTKEHLLRLAHYDVWRSFYQDDEGVIHWKAVSTSLITASQQVGPYEDTLVRGLGIFIDKKRKILNLGDKIIVDGAEVPMPEIKSKFVYERRRKVGFSTTNPLELDDLKLIKLMIDNFPWEHKIYPELLFGWLILAPLCGALRWRPHIWLTGATGSGKSTILEKLTLSLLEGFALGVEGETTEAGLRQKIDNNAIPIIFEEAEMDSNSSKKIIERNVSLARQASTETRTAIIKGSQNNQAVEFHLRSMFLFASVVPGIRNKADKDRIGVLVLDKARGAGNYELVKELLRDFEKIKNVPGKFIFFIYNKAEIILKNIEVFSDAIAEKYGKRFGDQYGSLLAGRAIIEGDKVFTRDEVIKFLEDNEINLDIFDSVIEDSQEKDILSTILEYETRIDYDDKTKTCTIGQLISGLCKAKSQITENINTTILENKLLSMGIKYRDSKIYFSVKSKALDKAVGYLNETNWQKLLERLPGALKTNNPINFGPGMGRRRAIAIPLELVDFGDSEDD